MADRIDGGEGKGGGGGGGGAQEGSDTDGWTLIDDDAAY